MLILNFIQTNVRFFSKKKQGCQIKSKDQQKTEIKEFIEIISLKSKYYKPSEKTNVFLDIQILSDEKILIDFHTDGLYNVGILGYP